MKSPFALLIIGCFLSSSLASRDSNGDKVHAEVLSYAQQNIGGVLPMMRTQALHLDCFYGFLPLINSFAAKARDVSNGCSYKANFDKDQGLKDLNKARAKIAAEIEEINKSLSDCSKLGGLDYFICLQDNTEINRVRIKAIKDQSQALMKKHNDKTGVIESDEQSCIMKAIANARAETDQAYIDLKECIVKGPIIQTQSDEVSSEEANTGTTGTDEANNSSIFV